jgi:uncharacterized repeat protein (TIGR03837 family)
LLFLFIAALIKKKTRPVWINLEYLSAEPWVAHYHALPSPHPRFPLTKTCFFPGFTPSTGGLLREKDLMVQRKAFDAAAERDFLQRKGLLERKPDTVRVLLFCYDTAPVGELIQVLSESSVPILLIVPQGNVAESIVTLLHHTSLPTERVIKHGQLTVQIIPFMEQGDFDRLLWSCDINFVRGEDSFVRTQWAASPFIWNIYPQTEGAHWSKLNAFAALYTAQMPMAMATAVREMWACWNGGNEISGAVWMNFFNCRESLMQHNKNWIKQLLESNDLTSNLIQFAENRL